MIEVLDMKKYRLVGAVPIKGVGRPLKPNEEVFVSSLVNPALEDNLAQRAVSEGILLSGPITVMVRFADGREAGVRLVPQ